MKNKLSLIIGVLFLSSLICHAQAPFFNPTKNDENLHVNFKQPLPPEAAMLWKFSNVPVNHHYGLANLSIPLYEVQAKGYTIPISLSYFSSGIKVSEVGPWTGCGWNLAAGGGVSREYNGGAPAAVDPDGYLYNKADIKKVFDNYHAAIISGGNDNADFYTNLETEDNEPDRFTISLPGINASFYLLYSNLPVFETKQDIKVSYENNLNGWIIIAPDGTKYICTKAEQSMSITGSVGPRSYTSNWKVSKIITALADTISFTYDKKSFIYYALPTAHQVRSWINGVPDAMKCTEITNNNRDDATESNTSISLTSYLLTNIHIASSKSDINFDVSQKRYDGGSPSNSYALKNIQVKNMNNILVKNIDFSYTYLTQNGFLNNPTASNANFRLLLDNVVINNSEKYQFAYNPGIDGLPPTDSHAQDEYGFYNGQNNNNTFCKKLEECPSILSNSSISSLKGLYGQCNRTSNNSYAIAGLLKSVQYPTGGKTDFTYVYGGDPGAFLIDKIADSGGQTRKYSYSNHSAFYATEADITHSVTYTPLDIATCQCLLKYCGKIYHWGLSISSSYLTRCMTDFPEFDYVTESLYSGTDLMGTSKYDYFNDADIVQTWNGMSLDAYRVVESTKWKRNLLKKVEVRDKNNKLTKEETWDYIFDNNGRENFYGQIVPVTSKPQMIDSINAIRLFPVFTINGFDWNNGKISNIFPVVPYTIKTHYYDLIQKSTFVSNISSTGVVDETKGVKSYTFYTYNPKNTFLSSNSSNNLTGQNDKDWTWYDPMEADDKELKTKYRYSSDFDTTTVSSSIIKSLLRRNMKDHIIEQQDWRYDKIVASQFFQYNEDGTLKNLYKAKLANPISAINFIGLDINGDLKPNSCYEIETAYDYDQNHNLIQSSSRSGLITSYLWGYNQNYPVAKVENATYAQLKALFGGTLPDFGGGGLTIAQENSLRALPNILVTTYTYKPLVGIVTATDPRGVVTKYDYDASGRLITKKDNSDKLLQSIEYNYKH